VGIATPSHAEAEERFARALAQVAPEVRRHLVLENDDRFYSLDRVIPLGRRLELPVVVDVLHHAVLPGAWGEAGCGELLERVFETWRPEDGPPKMHFSSQDPDKRAGAHAYGVDGGELERFLDQSRAVSRDFDIMFECKGKDLAVEEIMPILRADPRFTLAAKAAA
jgi:UV DNA damage endonuclease